MLTTGKYSKPKGSPFFHVSKQSNSHLCHKFFFWWAVTWKFKMPERLSLEKLHYSN